MSLSHRIIGEMPYKALQKQCFLWERGASVGVTLLTFKILHMHITYINTIKGRKTVKIK